MDIIILAIIIVVSGVLSTLLHFKCKAPTSKIEDATSGIHITIIPYIFK